MATDYKLSYTAVEIDEKLGMVDELSENKADKTEVESLVSSHNTATDAHADIRAEISQLSSEIIDEIAVMTQGEYKNMTPSDLAELYTKGVRIVAVTDTAYTNLVPLSIDANGNVYNGTGYMDGYRINSSYEIVEDTSANFTHTGFVPYVYDCIIRSKGSTCDDISATGQYITWYDSNFEPLFLSYLHNLVDMGVASYTVGEDGYYTFTYDTSYILQESKDQLVYFRLSHRDCYGANLIITINEEI